MKKTSSVPVLGGQSESVQVELDGACLTPLSSVNRHIQRGMLLCIVEQEERLASHKEAACIKE
eukprot:scaffold52821_cov21-Tisochrysis_lutea.AAC.1